MNVLDEIVKDQLRTDLPEIATGDTVKVSARVVEGNRERTQLFSYALSGAIVGDGIADHGDAEVGSSGARESAGAQPVG